ncbi:DUF2269 domain-containing protein [Variovorax humicola]|uniref:DUF2269 domain-containing protein n=1 Tax=Variovorax humicola TaxID=1769758 RepID=A0ABU8VYT9_9BURK
MNLYLTLKFLHILSSVVLVGTGFGSAYYMYFANRSRYRAAQSAVVPLVVRADWWFTAPTVIIQPITGVALAHMAGFPLTAPWLAASIALYFMAGACWLPVVWLQIRMSKLLANSDRTGSPLPPQYWTYARLWELLGYPAFLAMIAVFYLMVVKPSWGN